MTLFPGILLSSTTLKKTGVLSHPPQLRPSIRPGGICMTTPPERSMRGSSSIQMITVTKLAATMVLLPSQQRSAVRLPRFWLMTGISLCLQTDSSRSRVVMIPHTFMRLGLIGLKGMKGNLKNTRIIPFPFLQSWSTLPPGCLQSVKSVTKSTSTFRKQFQGFSG